MSRRTQQMAAEIKRAVEQVLAKGLSDPRVRGLITLTEITLSDDMRQATLSVSVMPEEHEDLTLHGLQAASRFIRRAAGELVAIKRMPELSFRADKRLKRQAAVLDAIAKARLDLETRTGPEGNNAPDEQSPNALDDAPPATEEPRP